MRTVQPITFVARLATGLACLLGASCADVDSTDSETEFETTSSELAMITRIKMDGPTFVAAGTDAFVSSWTESLCNGVSRAQITRIALSGIGQSTVLGGTDCDRTTMYGADANSLFVSTSVAGKEGDLVQLNRFNLTSRVLVPARSGLAIEDIIADHPDNIYYGTRNPSTNQIRLFRAAKSGGAPTEIRISSTNVMGLELFGFDSNFVYGAVLPPVNQINLRAKVIRFPVNGTSTSEVATFGEGLYPKDGAVGSGHVFVAERGGCGASLCSNIWKLRTSDLTFQGFVNQLQGRTMYEPKYDSAADRLYWYEDVVNRSGGTIWSRQNPIGGGSFRKEYDNNSNIAGTTGLTLNNLFPVTINGARGFAFSDSRSNEPRYVVGATVQ